MMLSEEKVSHLTHILLKGLMDRDLIALNEEEGTVRREMKRIISNELKVGADIDDQDDNDENSCGAVGHGHGYPFPGQDIKMYGQGSAGLKNGVGEP